jgi:multiple sugar transport system ATP-binding protein
MAELRVRNLSKAFGTNRVIEDLSFEVSKGGFYILLGPSGCGKSTVLRLIAGLERQDGGEIYIGDREVSGLTPRERDVAMVFQSYALYPHMNAYDNMAFPLKLRGLPKGEIDRKVRETARLLEMEEFLGRRPAGLSGGQRQRVALGRAIVREPKLFLFDEPLSNLDAQLRAAMRVELARLHQKMKTTMLYVTHDQVEAMTLGEKIILLDKGRIQQEGTPRELYQEPANLFVATFIGSPKINLIEGKIESRGENVLFNSDGLSLELRGMGWLRRYEGQGMTMGIRPEALTPGEGPLKGEIELVENVGSEVYVYLKVRGVRERVVAKAPPDFRGRPGEGVALTLDLSSLHFFQEGREGHEGKRVNQAGE